MAALPVGDLLGTRGAARFPPADAPKDPLVEKIEAIRRKILILERAPIQNRPLIEALQGQVEALNLVRERDVRCAQLEADNAAGVDIIRAQDERSAQQELLIAELRSKRDQRPALQQLPAPHPPRMVVSMEGSILALRVIGGTGLAVVVDFLFAGRH